MIRLLPSTLWYWIQPLTHSSLLLSLPIHLDNVLLILLMMSEQHVIKKYFVGTVALCRVWGPKFGDPGQALHRWARSRRQVATNNTNSYRWWEQPGTWQRVPGRGWYGRQEVSKSVEWSSSRQKFAPYFPLISARWCSLREEEWERTTYYQLAWPCTGHTMIVAKVAFRLSLFNHIPIHTYVDVTCYRPGKRPWLATLYVEPSVSNDTCYICPTSVHEKLGRMLMSFDHVLAAFLGTG